MIFIDVRVRAGMGRGGGGLSWPGRVDDWWHQALLTENQDK